MEPFGLRRTQSLRSLSGAQEKLWVMPAYASWNRKSVSQLVQHYQSFSDLTTSEKTKTTESCVDGARRKEDSRENVSLWSSGRNSNLSRSRSMEFLPQREAANTKALCALFESKANLQQSFNSSPQLNMSADGGKTRNDCHLQDWRSQNIPLKDPTMKKTNRRDEEKVMNGLQGIDNMMSRHTYDDKSIPSLNKGGTPITQTRARLSTSSSVKDRSALYLSKAATSDSTRDSKQPEFTGSPGTRSKVSKMADTNSKIRVSQPPYEEDELPLPPPPPIPPRPLDYEGPGTSSGLPAPPPKETFSIFYQQQQKSELKRLFRHIHPDLRATLDDAVDDELMRAVQSESGITDAAYQGEVQSMKWIFENWTMDNIGEAHETKKLLDNEELKGGDVRSTSSMFEHVDTSQCTPTMRQTSVRGDVRTSTWLFETQPLDSLNKFKEEEGELVEAVLKEPFHSGDVKGTRLLFEPTPLGDLGGRRLIDNQSFLKLKSELQEQKGEVQKTIKLFQTEPCCAIKDRHGNIHQVKSVCREEISSGQINTARWLFETQPLDLINKGSGTVKIIRGISLEEGSKGRVDQKRWMFETQPFEMIQETTGGDAFEGHLIDYAGEADVLNKKKLFETQSLETLNRDAGHQSSEKEVIIGGDVKTSLWLFETQPMETLSDSYEVGRLKKITLSAEEQGEVKGKKQVFESCHVAKNAAFKEQEFERGDVKGFKRLFETIPLGKITHPEKEFAEEKDVIEGGDVKANREMFETTPLYAIKDSSGSLHEVTTVSREEFIKGKVKNYKWMFETKPLDQLVQSKGNVEIIKGITREEDTSGNVQTAKWLFETQTIDGIHSKFNQASQTSTLEGVSKADVKTCKWLFETQPIDILYDKSENLQDQDAVENANVKSITWLLESKPLDNIKAGEPFNLKLCDTVQGAVRSEVPVQTVKHLFETETLDRIRRNSDAVQDLRCISQVNVQSGDVSRVKELFESQSLDEIGSVMETTADQQNQEEQIEKGSVHKFTWMFENCPMNQINKGPDGENIQRVGVSESGDVQNKKFIFETSSLDKIQEEPLEPKSVCIEEPVSNVDVKSSSMMFESLPLYAIRDKEGQFHEVTTVKKEEVMSGDVRGARWMFETKPLDSIKAENDVYVIRAVTQEDVKKGDVKSARWKFETQPLDSFTSRDKPSVVVTEDCESSNVQMNKKIFESDQSSKNIVRMVSVTDVQQGDVRTSTWLFENQTVDSLKGEPQDQSPGKKVFRQDSQKGDVKRCTWLFESQPLDSIKEPEETSVQSTEEIPKADVKCTTWLFETTPLDKITANSVAETLSCLYEMNYVHSSGIIIKSNENRNVIMAKYSLESEQGVQVQKKDIVKGNIRNIMLQLLLKPTLKPQITLLRETEKGQINTTVVELPIFQATTPVGIESDQRLRNIAQLIDEMLVHTEYLKKGIIMQETEWGQAEMSIYSMLSNSEIKMESLVTERGNVKSTIGNLLASANNQTTAAWCRVDENEKGNVNLYKSCIEKGDLQYLRSLHVDPCEDEVDSRLVDKEEVAIAQGGVEEAKRTLCQQKDQIEKTILDILPGDVKKTKKLFSAEGSASVESCVTKEEIIKGDISSAKQQLAVKIPITVDKEEIVPGDIKAMMESLERAKQQSMCVEKEIIKPGTIYDMDLSSEVSEDEGNQAQREVIVAGDVKAAKKSLEKAKQQSMHMEREVVVPGKIYNVSMNTQEESSSTVAESTCSSASRCQQIKTYPKVSDAEKDQGSHVFFQACQQNVDLFNNYPQKAFPPYVNCDFNGQTTEDEEEEVVKGDVKATIRSLQSAATEQKFKATENIVRGNVQSALESLERSSVNVSKGDFKTALMYRNSARTCSGTSKTVQSQSFMVSDTNLSPSFPVTCEGEPTITTQTSTANNVANGKLSTSDCGTPPPIPEKSEKQKENKPALPPKPQWMKSVTVEGSNRQSTPKIPSIGEDHNNLLKQRQQNPMQSMNKEKTPTQTKMDKETRKQTNSDPTGKHLKNTSKATTKTAARADRTSDHRDGLILPNNNEVHIDKNGIRKNNEDLQMCRKNHGDNVKCEMSRHFQEGSQGFRADLEVLDRETTISKQVKVTNESNETLLPPNSTNFQSRTETQTSKDTNSIPGSHQNNLSQNKEAEHKVVLREKKRRETEDERRQRLSVHKDEIMKENANAAMEIFENLRKREELKGILSQVEEIEGEASTADTCTATPLYVNVPAWMVKPNKNTKKSKIVAKKVEVEPQDDDLESISSVEMAFEDLEKASKDIMKLKEQTLQKLLDIEETIKKALYSVSNLKSEADIAGLSGLFDESLKSEQNLQPSNNLRKISIVSKKAKFGDKRETHLDSSASTREKDVTKEANKKPLIRQSSSQSSPSFISIHSARKPSEQPKPTMSTFKPKPENSTTPKTSQNGLCPQRNISVLEVKTVPEQPPGIVGTKTVSETYEESDGFGNRFVSSTTSTFFTNHPDSKPSPLFEVVSPTRYEVMSPLQKKAKHPYKEEGLCKPKDEGTVFVTFAQPRDKH